MWKIVTAAFFSMSLPAFAALPPFHDSAEQIRAVLTNDEVAETLGASRTIESVSKLGNLKYVVRTESECGVIVELKAHVPTNPGPTKYSVKDVSGLMCE